MNNVETTIKTLIETQVIQALNNAPEAIEKMVKAAMSAPVDSVTGTYDGYRGTKVPYLEFMVGEEIRGAARTAARKVILEKMPDIEEMIRKGLSSDTVVAAVTKSFADTAAQDWRINVTFAAEDKRR